jgi:PadR family transcriptional regulator, regulatory protein AphA
MMPVRESQVLVAVHRDHHIALLEKFEAIERSMSAGPMTDEQKVYLRATLSYGQAVSRALIQWSDATEKTLRTLKSSLLDS